MKTKWWVYHIYCKTFLDILQLSYILYLTYPKLFVIITSHLQGPDDFLIEETKKRRLSELRIFTANLIKYEKGIK